MSEGKLHIGYNEFQKLAPAEQDAAKDWVKQSFDCDPNYIEWIELPDTADLVNHAMRVNLLLEQQPERPTLLSELHHVRIATAPDEQLLAKLVEVGS